MMSITRRIAVVLGVFAVALAASPVSAFDDINMATAISVEGGHIVARWSTSGFDHYNIRWSANGGPAHQVERNGDKDFVYLTPFQPNTVYSVAVQGCESHMLGSSRCTTWDETRCGTADQRCYGTGLGSPGVSARCKSGFVWREVNPSDHVCVVPSSRDLVAQENTMANARRNPRGAYGPNTCISGFIWREAVSGDYVCVNPNRRDAVREENALAPSRTQ